MAFRRDDACPVVKAAIYARVWVLGINGTKNRVKNVMHLTIGRLGLRWITAF